MPLTSVIKYVFCIYIYMLKKIQLQKIKDLKTTKNAKLSIDTLTSLTEKLSK